MNRQDWLKGTLYSPDFEQDSCGFGLIAQIDDKPAHHLVQTAISSLACMTHRGAVAADGLSGDGCGLLFKKPDAFLRAVAADAGISLAPLYAAGLVFLSRDAAAAERARAAIRAELTAQGCEVAGFRALPIDTSVCGKYAMESLPHIEQVFVNAPASLDEGHFERALYIARRRTEKALFPVDPVYFQPTLSSRVISYKGLVLPENLATFYTDLNDPRFESSLIVFHQRFSTNTWPQWRLAQPFRMLAHNGEINTVAGNRNWSRAREVKFESDLIPNMDDIRPIVSTTGSDSMSLDNMLEALVMGGSNLFRSLRLLVPPAWQNNDAMDPDIRAFYEYNSMHGEPWDGPAGIVLTDGRYAVCTLDRNGLRPARWALTEDRILTIASEIGVWEADPAKVVRKGRVKPGQMIVADLQTGELLMSEDIDNLLKKQHPYRAWLDAHSQHPEFGDTQDAALPQLDAKALLVEQKLFNVSFEERDQIIRVLAEDGNEAIGSMGDDTPMAVLSRKVRSPFDYLRQQFAQVTNPPIDPIREAIVMSLATCFGPERNLFEETADHAHRIGIESPILSRDAFNALTTLADPAFKATTLSLAYDPAQQSLKDAVAAVAQQAVEAVRSGHVVIVLTDRDVPKGKLPVPMLFAVGAVHHALIDAGQRCNANIVSETGSVRDPHHYACLVGYGATAIYPWLAYQVIAEFVRSGEVKLPLDKALANYRNGMDKGLYKILSKMGISAVSSYRGAQLFEAVGLNEEVVGLALKGTVSRISGANFTDFEDDLKALSKLAHNPQRPLTAGGLLKFMFGEEFHAYNPDVVQQLQKAVKQGDYALYRQYAETVNKRPVAMFRDLMHVKTRETPLPIDEIEPVESILKRFDSAGMSLGALSPEAHEALAEGMNRIGGRSNSGEGGEDPARYGTVKTSKIKQVASGRFGVTPTYLVNAEVLQIKVAQGAKPGEGGQLPGDKVSDTIARLRHCKPGTPLISPPPHHDIYSIEDLAQLIFDLKQVNPDALVSVKLVAEPGVGTVAAGVAKAYADLITISGYDGGTGASPLTSVKYAGTPWELGLSEAQQVLRANGLRGRVLVQTDGGLKTGLDVVKAAILGAESFGFGTAPMIALGCKYLRICHLNNCATGVATQNVTLRKEHFIGLPEMVVNFFRFVAEETREWLAKLGVRSLEELIGRTDLLELLPGETERQQRLKLDVLLSHGDIPADEPRFCIQNRNPSFDKGELAEQMVLDTAAAIAGKKPVKLRYGIRNYNRSIGARVSGEIAKKWGSAGLPDDCITVDFEGSAGQSFGVWNAPGLTLRVEGDANDYTGKGMAGGRLIVFPPKAAQYEACRNIIIGNTCLYGATAGELFAAGMAGERFAVRNSGASAVVEGVGDHGCEYMTGGCVIVLGDTGVNFGAGMSGGMAFIYDESGLFAGRVNREMVDTHRINGADGAPYRTFLRMQMERHAALTGSARAKTLLADFDATLERVWLVKPRRMTMETLVADLPRAAEAVTA